MSRTRRELLRDAGVVTASAAVLGPTASWAAKRKATLSGLAKRLRGPLVLPGQSGYAAAKQIWNPRYDISPKAVAFCHGPADVAQVLRFARERHMPVTARSGRHSFAGYSNTTGIVADVSAMKTIALDRAAGTVRVGAGVNNQDVYEKLLLAQGVTIPSGTCPTVGIAGLTLGGGQSRALRKVGMLVDNLVGATVVLADGRTVHCDASHEADLFWALRGGGGGNFGVVTDFTFRVIPTRSITTYSMSWDWANAAAGFDAWQRSMPHAPQDMAVSTFRLIHNPDGTLTATSNGHWWGDPAAINDVIAPLVASGPSRKATATGPMEGSWRPDGCQVDQATKAVNCTVTRYPNFQRSDFFADVIPAAGIQTMLDFISRWPGGEGSHEGGLQFEAYGAESAVNAISPTATAWVHRRQLLHAVYLNFWGPTNPPPVVQANVQWVRDFYDAMRPYASGEAYQNYIDPELQTWQRAYYGQNLARLKRVKRAVDPHRLFAFRQGISPS